MSPLEFGELISSPVDGRRTAQELAGVWRPVGGGDGQHELLLNVKGRVAGLGHEAGTEVQRLAAPGVKNDQRQADQRECKGSLPSHHGLGGARGQQVDRGDD